MIHEVEALFERQARAWPQLAKGIEGLASAKTRQVRIDWFDVFVRHIPHRVGSTTAPVDRESVTKRPCFLCAGNLPPEEGRAVSVRTSRSTVIRFQSSIVTSLSLIRSTARSVLRTSSEICWTLPQACRDISSSTTVPMRSVGTGPHALSGGLAKVVSVEHDTAGISGVTVLNYRRNVFVFRGRERSPLIDRMDRAIELLAQATGKRPEPLVNLAVFHQRDEWVTYLFPRGKHRPEVFYSGELTVSPASIDLCGIFVVPIAHDFEKITGDAIAAVFRDSPAGRSVSRSCREAEIVSLERICRT